MSVIKDEAELLEIIGPLSISEETSKRYDELSKKIDRILQKNSKKKIKKIKKYK